MALVSASKTPFAIDADTGSVDAGTVVGGIIAAAAIAGVIGVIAFVVAPAVLLSYRMKKSTRSRAFRVSASSRAVLNPASLVRAVPSASSRAAAIGTTAAV